MILVKTNVDETRTNIIDSILTMNEEQLDAFSAVVDVITSGGSDEEARAAIVRAKEKHRTLTHLERNRIMSGFTRETLSEISGVPVSVIKGIEERTVNSVTVGDILHLAKALDVDPGKLFN